MSAATYSRAVGSRVVVKSSVRVGSLQLVSKATSSERNAIIDAADSMRTRVSTALLRTVEVVKDGISLKMLEDKLQVADLNGVLQILDLDNRFQAAAKGAGLQPNETSFLEAIKDTWAAGARAELDSLSKVPVHKSNPCHVPSGPQGGQFCETGANAVGVSETSHERMIREGRGYTKLITVDAKKFKGAWEEAHPGETLDWNPQRMERLKATDTFQGFPQVYVDWKGNVDLLDGRHRIATVAQRGGAITVATPPDVSIPKELYADVKKVDEDISKASDTIGMMLAFDLSKVPVHKSNPCHVPSGPKGGQFCETGSGARFSDTGFDGGQNPWLDAQGNRQLPKLSNVNLTASPLKQEPGISIMTARTKLLDGETIGRSPLKEVTVDDLYGWQAIVIGASLRPFDATTAPPLRVVKWQDRLIVYDGNNRAAAAWASGTKTVKANVLDLDDPKNKKYIQSKYRMEVGKSEVAKADSTIGMMLAFDLVNPETIAWLSTYVMALIRQVSDETRRAIADVVMNAFQYGGHPYEQARTIRNMIGLTQQQSQAVANFRKMLENEPLAALTRDLRDRRFDPTLQSIGRLKGQLTQEQIDKMSDAYYRKYLKYRAEMIARTETIRASRYGQEATWRQAIAQGLLPQDMKRKWVVTHDDRLCPSCRSIPRLNPEGRGMDEQFMSDIGTVDGPPLHPHCRCALVKKVDWGVSKAEEVVKINPCHKPVGTSTGGQFCETKGASSTKAAVTGVLTELTDGVKNQYAKDVASWYAKSAERFVNEVQQDTRFQNKNIGGVWGANYAFHKNAMKMYAEPIRVAVDVEHTQRGSMVAWNRNEPVSASTIYKLKPDYAVRSGKAGREAADFMQQEFLDKNTRKLVPILDQKGNLQSARLLSSSASQGMIEGDSRFTFTDGSAFTVRNKVILNFRNGKPYNQFPTTFHDVRLPGGKPMAGPSEARMAEVFGGAK